jgi:Cytochrome b(C-terminal)/b6/petD
MAEEKAAAIQEQPAKKAVQAKKKEKNPHVWPELLFKELMSAIVVMILLIVWALWLDAPLGEIATPSRTENPAKAPWYFIGLQEILVYFDPWYSGVVMPSIIMVGLMAIPYLDTNPKGVGEYSFSTRKFAVINFLIGYFMWMFAIVVGQFMRGPSWLFFWPWEVWDDSGIHAEVLLVNIDNTISMICLGIYFALGFILPKLFKMKWAQNLDWVRYSIVISLLLLMYMVPVKVVLRQLFHVRYLITTPWLNI